MASSNNYTDSASNFTEVFRSVSIFNFHIERIPEREKWFVYTRVKLYYQHFKKEIYFKIFKGHLFKLGSSKK